MARLGGIAHRAETLLGTAVVATTPVAGGDICTATRLRLSNGTSALIKTRPHAPADFFRTEAAGLRWLAEAGGAGTPEVLAVEDDCLIVALGRGQPAHLRGRRDVRPPARRDPRPRARRVRRPSPAPTATSARCRCPTAPRRPGRSSTRPAGCCPTSSSPRDRGGISASDAGAVERVVRRIVDLAGPDEPPARLHGDLWSGNLVWGLGSRVWLIDPASYGGHRETDLAMLSLFGCPQLPRVLESYAEASPLADGWQDRVALHQLFPLLVHACHFGAGSAGTGYGARAGDAARSLL